MAKLSSSAGVDHQREGGEPHEPGGELARPQAPRARAEGKRLAGEGGRECRRKNAARRRGARDPRTQHRRAEHRCEQRDGEGRGAGQAARRVDGAAQRHHLEPGEHDRDRGEVARLVDDDRRQRRSGGDPVPAPQPPCTRGVAGSDGQHVVEESAGRVHGEGADHAHRRKGSQEQEPAPGADHAREQEQEHHRRHGPPAVHARVGGDLRQRDRAQPQPQQGETERGLQSEPRPARHAISTAGPVRTHRCANAQNAKRKATNMIVPP